MKLKQILLFGSMLLLAACSLRPASSKPTATPADVTITVYFTDVPNFNAGIEPYEKAVTRTVPFTQDLPGAVLSQLFLGPTPAEKSQGLDVFTNGATGFSKWTLADGIARVYLRGDCNSNGAAYTIANLIDVNLKQFPEIKWVKLYDPAGQTESPDGESGSIPFCLEP